MTALKRCSTTSAWKIRFPENHLLRLIEKHVSFEFVRERLRASYSETGRPSIDPELLLRRPEPKDG
jgi:transposase